MASIPKTLLVAAALAVAAPATAFDVGDGLLSVSGFGRWGYGNTDGNAYLLGRDAGKGDNIGMALNIFSKPMDRLAVSTQIFYDASKINIDWAFAEYRLYDWLRFRAGQVKMPFTAYMETKDVGTLRPFYNLPASIYSFSDLAAESYFGGGFTGFIPPMAGWELSYDVFFGQIWLESSDRFRPAPSALNLAAAKQDQFANPGPPRQTIFTRVDNTVGGRLTIGTPITGLRAYLSGYRGTVADLGSQVQGADPDSNVHAAGLSLEFIREQVEVRAEGFRKRDIEAAVRLPYGFQVAGRAESATYELRKTTVSGTSTLGTTVTPYTYTIPNSLRRHLEYAIGLNYWFNSDFVLKTSYHWIDGNRFAVPEYPWNNYTTDGNNTAASLTDITYGAKTQMLLVGAQFAF
jgi:hypothetical protein